MLPRIPNRSTTYYKITNEKENHNGLQYHDGLVVDPNEFNKDPKKQHEENGIYFTTKELLHEFFMYGCWIRPISIHEDANVILDPQGDRYRADKVIFEDRKTFDYYFDNLFDIKTFPKSGYKILMLGYKDYFEKWFDKEYFNYDEYSWILAKHYEDRFYDWYDVDKYNHKQDDWALAHYCPRKFNLWFDKKTFNYFNHSWVLPQYCANHYKTWFDKECYNYKSSYALINYTLRYFDDWFDKELFDYEENSWALAFFCPEKFDVWFDKDKYNYEKDGWALQKFCPEEYNKK